MALSDLADPEGAVRSWGFKHVFRWTDRPYALLSNFTYLTHSLTQASRNAWYPSHSHSGLTTHLITAGELTITYPNDVEPKKETFAKGARLDVDAGRLHEVVMGNEGCTYVIGE